MPELPEVETIVQDIRPDLVGRTIRRASLSHVDVLRGVTRPKLLAALKGAAIRSVTRRAKHAVIALGERRLVIQPGMTGSLTVRRDPLSRDEAKYAVLRAPLDSGRELVYQDVRRLGTLLLLNERQWAAYDAAIEAEGTTFRDYRTGTGEPGNFQLELLVYGREDEPCRRCGTRLVGTHTIDARISVFCYRCQW